MDNSVLSRSAFSKTSRQFFSGIAALALFGMAASWMPRPGAVEAQVAAVEQPGPRYTVELSAPISSSNIEVTVEQPAADVLPVVVEEAPAPTTALLAWGAVVSPEFRDSIRQLCDFLGCQPDHMMAAMAFETSETFSPSVRNRVSGATGLIQFMSSTARELGTTTDELAQLSAEDQLWYVQRYFRPYRGRLTTLEDVYMAILWPRAVGQPNEYGLFAEGTAAYRQNAYLDIDQDGTITKQEASSHVAAKLRKGLQASYLA